jgi:hypothetical protein
MREARTAREDRQPCQARCGDATSDPCNAVFQVPLIFDTGISCVMSCLFSHCLLPNHLEARADGEGGVIGDERDRKDGAPFCRYLPLCA